MFCRLEAKVGNGNRRTLSRDYDDGRGCAIETALVLQNLVRGYIISAFLYRLKFLILN